MMHALENIIRKEKNAGNQNFLLFQFFFLCYQRNKMLLLNVPALKHFLFFFAITKKYKSKYVLQKD